MPAPIESQLQANLGRWFILISCGHHSCGLAGDPIHGLRPLSWLMSSARSAMRNPIAVMGIIIATANTAALHGPARSIRLPAILAKNAKGIPYIVKLTPTNNVRSQVFHKPCPDSLCQRGKEGLLQKNSSERLLSANDKRTDSVREILFSAIGAERSLTSEAWQYRISAHAKVRAFSPQISLIKAPTTGPATIRCFSCS